MAVCCGSSLLSKEVAERKAWGEVGWGVRTDVDGAGDTTRHAVYSANLATTLSVALSVLLGAALAGLGLGLQAQRHGTAGWAVVVTTFGVIFWAIQLIFFVQELHSVLLAVLAFGMLAMFAALSALAWKAHREMCADPPPPDQEVLSAGYNVPYSHLHDDPPEVRLAAELAQRRQRLLVQQKELDMLEERIRRHGHKPPGAKP